MSARRPGAVAEWTPAHQTDIALTVGRLQRGRNDPVQRLVDGVLWRTVRTPEGGATVRVDAAAGRLRVAAWGAGADAAAASVPDLLGARDDPSGFEPRHPVLVDAHRRFPGLRIGGTGDVFQAVVAAALEQRVVGLDAGASWGRLVRRLGEPAHGPGPPGMVVFPPPRVWAAIPSWEWHRAGVDLKRASVIQAAARVGDALQRLVDRDAAQADAALRSIPGVGVWTSAEVRQRALGHADALSVGDYHLAAIVGEVLEKRPFTDAEMVAYLERWRGHRYRVARLLYALGYEGLPRHAPRATRVDHRGR